MTESWLPAHLRNLIEIEHGFAFEGEFFTNEPTSEILLTPGNFAIGGGFKGDKVKYYNGPVPDEYILAPGELIITMTDLSKASDTLGYPALVPQSPGKRYLHNQRLGKVTILDRAQLDEHFLFYLLRTQEYRHEVLASASGSVIKHTSPDRIRAFRFLRPPLPEQRAIAHILGTLDDKIEVNRRMNKTLEAMARALFKSWFVDFDPVRAMMEGRQQPGMDAETAALFPDSFENSPLGRLPRGWRVGPLAEIADIIMGQSPPGETYNEAGEGLPFYQGIRDFGFRFPGRRVYCTAPTRFAEKGDVLLSVRAPVGSLNVAIEPCSIGRGIAALRLRTKPGGFLYYLLKSSQSEWERFEAQGTVFGSVAKNDVQSLRVIVPSIDLVRRYGSFVDPMDIEIENNERENQTLATLRDALLPKLISGELRIKQAQPGVAGLT